MLRINLPQLKSQIEIENLMLDFNGTMAKDGMLLPNVKKVINEISKMLKIHIVTADTFGSIETQVKDIDCILHIVEPQNQAIAKLNYLQSINPDRTICIGNGFNDELMLKESKIGIAVVQAEGASIFAIKSSDIVCFSIVDALELIINPLRLVATLRN